MKMFHTLWELSSPNGSNIRPGLLVEIAQGGDRLGDRTNDISARDEVGLRQDMGREPLPDENNSSSLSVGRYPRGYRYSIAALETRLWVLLGSVATL